LELDQGMDALSLNTFDAIVIGVLLVSSLIGLSRGITKEILSIAAWVGAAFATYKFHEPAGRFARTYISPDNLADIAGAAAVFIGALIVLSLVFGMITNRVKDSVLGPVDRSLGVMFGLARGALLVCLAYLVMALLLPPIDRPAFAKLGQTKPLVEQGAILLYDLAPLSHKGSSDARIRGAMPAPNESNDSDTPTQPAAPLPGTTETRAPVIETPDRRAETGYRPDDAKSMDELIKKAKEK
jgi:membrane protein required for colicin V production